jgi:hypothetical protein
MKYIKHINEYNLYHEINISLSDISTNDDLIFNKSTYDLICNRYHYLQIKKKNANNAILLLTDRARIDIWETNDEYFYVFIFIVGGSVSNSYKNEYKCDTIQGLYQLIDAYLNTYEDYMKYDIKESISFKNNELYKQISESEFYMTKPPLSYFINMSKENINKLSNVLRHEKGFEVIKFENLSYIRFYSIPGTVHILEIDDYYFKVSTGFHHYLCDQIDGVIKLLKDKEIL